MAGETRGAHVPKFFCDVGDLMEDSLSCWQTIQAECHEMGEQHQMYCSKHQSEPNMVKETPPDHSMNRPRPSPPLLH